MMSFNVKCVKACLVNSGRVFTVRHYKSEVQEDKVEVAGVGVCKRYRVKRVSAPEDVAMYVKLSGFSNVQDWWRKVTSFGACNGWLYLVVKG